MPNMVYLAFIIAEIRVFEQTVRQIDTDTDDRLTDIQIDMQINRQIDILIDTQVYK